MIVTFLGTGAATACPLPFCRCEACRIARERGGLELRARSAVLIDGELLIDMGPDVVGAAHRMGVDLTKVRYWLQTHAHSDHFDAGHAITRIDEYAVRDVPPMLLVASVRCLECMSERLAMEEPGAGFLDGGWLERLHMDARTVAHGDRVDMGPYRVTAIESAHDPAAGSMMYAIERAGAAFLYAVDTIEFTRDAWQLMRDRAMRFDAVAIDHTYGPGVAGGGHLNADQVAETVARMRAEGIMKHGAAAYATHLSHEGNPPHKELKQIALARGYDVAYDGLSINIPDPRLPE